jgi:hypothetical protein
VEQNLLLRYNRLHDSEIYQANASRDGMDGVGVDVGTYRCHVGLDADTDGTPMTVRLQSHGFGGPATPLR